MCHGKIRDVSVIYTGSSTADFVYLTFPELFDSIACIFSEIVTSEYFVRTAMHERTVEEFSVDTTARNVNCYIFPLNLSLVAASSVTTRFVYFRCGCARCTAICGSRYG